MCARAHPLPLLKKILTLARRQCPATNWTTWAGLSLFTPEALEVGRGAADIARTIDDWNLAQANARSNDDDDASPAQRT